MTETTTRARALTLKDADYLGFDGGVTDRFLVYGDETDGRVAVVEHRLPPRTLAAPLHRHTRDDEFSYVLEGRVGAIFDGVETVAGPGDMIRKPRGEWHTFWNAGDETARILEVITPAGLEQLFRALDAMDGWPEPEELVAMASSHGCELDFEGTAPIAERHGLAF